MVATVGPCKVFAWVGAGMTDSTGRAHHTQPMPAVAKIATASHKILCQIDTATKPRKG